MGAATGELARGLYFYHARYYDPTLARFIQPDTLVPDPGDPQSLNRYSYVGNNPVRYTDPSGHRVVEDNFGVHSCNTGASIYNCIYPQGHPLAGYPIGTTQEDIEQAQAEMRSTGEAIAGFLFEPADWVFTINRWRQGDFSYWDLAGLAPLVPASGARVLGKRIIRYVDIVPTGQWHHVFSNKIMQALEEHRTLAGQFKRNDILVQALDRESHIGYQKWHRAYDDEVIEWLENNQTASPAEFLDFLQEIYTRPDMLRRFPFAKEALDALRIQFR